MFACSLFCFLLFVLTIYYIRCWYEEIWCLRAFFLWKASLFLVSGHKDGANLIPHPYSRHRQTPSVQIKYQPAPKREHQLFSSCEIFWRNSEYKNQKVNASYVVLCYVLSTHVILIGSYYRRSPAHASDLWQSDWGGQGGRPVALLHQWERHWYSPYLPDK